MSKISKISYDVPLRENMRVFFTQQGLRGRNILSVAAAPFIAEKKLRLNGFEVVSVPLFNHKILKIDLQELRFALKELFSLVLLKDIDFIFRDEFKSGKFLKIDSTSHTHQAVSLFSGGVDSYCGILEAHKRKLKVAGLFCAHSDQSKIISIVDDFSNEIFATLGMKLYKINVPAIEAMGYSQMRGFLYFVSAAAWMDLLGANKLIITEVGPTMYQPRFTHFESVTLTAHPYVLELAVKVIEMLLGRKIDLILPYENMTKAETISSCHQKQNLKKTHSCITQRFGKHEGTCYACIMRRLAFIAAGIEDASYKKNPITDASANPDNLLPLLLYNHSYLTGYKDMAYFQIENIEMFKKYDLFKRFALDNFAAIHKLIESGERVIDPVVKIYKDVAHKVGIDVLEKRLDDLQKRVVVPNFKTPFDFKTL